MNQKMKKGNPHLGSRFDDFLKHEGIFGDLHASAIACRGRID
jgi:hypothetical protein